MVSQAGQVVRVSGWVRAVPIVTAFLVGAASFTLSFFAQSELAAQLGAVPAAMAWLVPVVIDGGILAGSAAVWSSSTRRARKDPVAYLTVFALLALSVVINVEHAADQGGVLGSVIAGAPPVVLLLCLELVAAQARREALGAAAPAHAAVVAEAPAPVVEAPTSGGVPTVPVRADGPSSGLAVAVRPSSVGVSTSAPTGEVRPVVSKVSQATGVSVPASSTVVDSRPGVGSVAVAAAEPSRRVSAVAPGRPTEVPAVPSGDESSSRRGSAEGSGVSTAARVRDLFAAHVAAGGDAMDSTLARRFAEELGSPVASVRRVLSAERRALQDA